MNATAKETAETSAPVAQASALHMYRALVGVGLLCGLLIVGVYQWTLPLIEANKAEALEQAIFEVLPAASSSGTFVLSDGAFSPATADAPPEQTVYAGYDDSGQLVGFAIAAQGMGYQDIIRVLYGYSFEEDAIVGMQVLESRETPGLGDKIEKDDTFLENFVRLDVSLNEDGSAIANPIEAVKPGEKVSPWQVDTITGATISSNAIAEILRDSSSSWVPQIEPRLADFER